MDDELTTFILKARGIRKVVTSEAQTKHSAAVEEQCMYGGCVATPSEWIGNVVVTP